MTNNHIYDCRFQNLIRRNYLAFLHFQAIYAHHKGIPAAAAVNLVPHDRFLRDFQKRLAALRAFEPVDVIQSPTLPF